MLQRLYRKLQKQFPDILFFGDTTRREIALTFDDGPHPRDTPQVLDVLARHDVRATFFLIGKGVKQHPHLVKEIHDGGHQLALHCYRHLPFPMENASTLKGQLDQSREVIANACGISPETIRHIRPPYGAFTARTLSHLTEWGYQLTMWSCIPQHWMQPTSWSIKQVLNETFPGAIVVLHDGHGHGTKVATILETIIPKLKAQGFNFINIEDMERKRSNEQSLLHRSVETRQL